MKASMEWMEASGARFIPGRGTSGCAQLTNYTASYCEWGDGPPIVLIPGLAGGLELLGPLAKILANNFRVISYQLRGEENCFALRHHFQLRDLVNDLSEFVDCLCLESPTILGTSFGGVLGLEYATRFPHRLDRLIVQGAGPHFESNLLQSVAGAVLSRYPMLADNPFINQFFNLLFGGRQKKDALFGFVTSQYWRTDQSVMAHRLRLVETFDVDDRLHQIHVPTLILAGERDLMVSPGGLQTLREGIDNCQVMTLPGCGHLAPVTHPELVAQKVRDFCKSEELTCPTA